MPTTDPQPDPTKDAVLALADELVSVMTVEIYAAMLDEPSMKNKFSDRVHLRQQRARQTVDALLPLITARIAQARAQERERAADIAETIGGAAADEKAMGKNIGDYGEGYIAACDDVAVWIRGDDSDFSDRAGKETNDV